MSLICTRTETFWQNQKGNKKIKKILSSSKVHSNGIQKAHTTHLHKVESFVLV